MPPSRGTATGAIRPGDVIVLMGRGPVGSGMEEVFQLTSSLRYLSWGHEVALVTDARFSGVSTGACIGMVTPEALAGGPLGKVRDGDRIRIVIDRNRLEGSVDLVGDAQREFGPEEGARVLAERSPHPDLAPDPLLPPKRGSGPPCRTSAAAPGAAACSTWTRSRRDCRRDRRTAFPGRRPRVSPDACVCAGKPYRRS